MPKPLQADWPLIQQLYIAGLSLNEISTKTGVKCATIACRASRANWKGIASKAREAVQQVTVEALEKPQEAKLARQSERARSGLAATLERFVAKIETLDPKTAKAALKASGELESVVRNCKTVFGWSDGSAAPSVRIGVLQSLTLAVPTPVPEAIDIETDRPEPT